MANYNGYARSNYFRVTSAAALRKKLAPLEIKVHDGTPGIPDQAGRVCLISEAEGGWPNWYFDDETGQEVEIDVAQIIAEFLAPNEVAVLIEIGFEKMRYLIGFACAVNAAGETRSINLDAIYPLASELGENVTEASG